ncbi:MFS general substrate transporter [Astrocystis sublimbata]|nr:MFS general substrate transporter [Astrocystis sublimbata]
MADPTDRSDESRPLLEEPLPGQSRERPDPSIDTFVLSRNTYFCLALTFLLEMSNVMLTVPLLSILERAICQDYYTSQQISQSFMMSDKCKIPAVQSELAMLRGWQGFLNGLASLVVSLPLGYFADRHSHRKTFVYIIAGMFAALAWTIFVCVVEAVPNRLLWLTSVFLLCGGGNYAAEMLLAIMVVGSTTESSRTRCLYYMYSTFILTELFGPQLSKWSSEVTVWLPFGMGLSFLLLCYPVLAMMSESRNTIEDTQGDDLEPPESRDGNFWHNLRLEASKRLSSVLLLFNSRNICLATPLFLVGTFRNVSLRALLQFVSVRFEWSLSETNWLITEVASVNLLLFFILLPGIIYLVNSRIGPSPQTLNLWIVRCSFAVLVVGSALISFSRTSRGLVLSLGFYALGFGARATLLFLVTSWFDVTVRGRLYSAILLLELVGLLSGEAVVQNLLAFSFTLPDQWMGIAFLFCTAGYLIALLASLGITIDPKDSAAGSREHDEVNGWSG